MHTKPDLHSPVTCKNCGHVFTSNYCNNCGEKVYHDHDKSIPHFFEDALHFVSHLDGTFFTTLKTIFTKPGQLSLDYCSGKRKKYFKPLSFFLLLVVLYLLFPLFEGLNVRLRYYPRLFGTFAQNWVETKAANKHITQEELSELFAHKSEKWSKLLLLVIIPLSAFPLWLLHIRKRKYFFDHLVLSTEINSFLLLMVFLVWASFIRLIVNLVPMSWVEGDGPLVSGGYLFVGLFTFFAFRRFYNEKYWIAFVKAVVFLVMQFFIIFILYKLLLFVAVMLTL